MLIRSYDKVPDLKEDFCTSKGEEGATSCSGFFIVNVTERPSEAHIAEKRGDGKFYYIHPSLRHDKRYWGMTPSNPTPIEAFGMVVAVKDGIFVGVRDYTAQVTATYMDGGERRWQGSRTFSFPFQYDQ